MVNFELLHNPTVEDVLKYINHLADSVEIQLANKPEEQTRAVLLRLLALLKEQPVQKWIESFKKRKVNIPAWHKIVEIDNCLDDLYLKQFEIPFPDDYFLKENRKKERSQYMSLMILLWGLFGFEWEVD